MNRNFRFDPTRVDSYIEKIISSLVYDNEKPIIIFPKDW